MNGDSSAGERPRSRPTVKLLYSEDDALCRPLAILFDRLSHEPPNVLDWEDKFASEFDAIGLHQLKPLDVVEHPLRLKLQGNAYYRVTFSGETQPRLVYLEDLWGRGAFATNVFIFKTDNDTGVDWQAIPPKGHPGLDMPSKIALAIAFGWNAYAFENKGYDVAELPYYFDKLSHDSNSDGPIGLSTNLPYAIQRIFAFRGKGFVVAEDELGFLVYRIKADAVDDVCYMSSASDK